MSPTDQVREQLLAAIERGDFLPGSALPSERKLCEMFRVSRVAAREALAGLEAMKLIVIQHGRGAFVRENVNVQYAGPFAEYLRLQRTELIELLKVRGALDALAAEEVAVHGSDVDIDEIEHAAEDFARVAEAEQRNVSELARLDIAFHLSIANASGGTLLPNLLAELNDVLKESRSATLSRDGQAIKSVSEHRAIVDALRSRDGAAARHAVVGHMSGIQNWLEQLSDADDD
ncbi:FadR/GntR family transcriptional regulator [Saccharopolyspora pogona]|uniref:FadR/GntR family transcriptional regulator n=1 Tax=Saccharopolyspora pogona TaxID=333966 RepID=UPI0016884A96|nr:FCD domain-containing protein [Saccharopolyspora pogona]